MEDPLDTVGRHRPVQIEIRSAVALHVGDRIHDVLQQMRNRNTVENDDFVALPQQSADKMGTDEARAARYENTHETSPGMPPRLKEASVLTPEWFLLYTLCK